MCPMCWATVLASFAVVFAASAVVVVGTDVLTLASAALLGGASLAHLNGMATIPWWAFAAAAVLIVARIAYIMVRRRDRLLITLAWRKAHAIAKRTCPTRSAAN